MKVTSEKQALYINRLTYNLYKLNGCINKNTIIFPDEAQRLPIDIASDMISELKIKIYNKEMEIYVYPYLHGMDKFVEVKPISKSESIKVDSIKPEENNLIVTMVDGTEVIIEENKKLLLGQSQVSLKEAYNEFVKAINHDLEVMIYKGSMQIVISIKGTEESNLLIESIDTLNEVLEIMGNKMPISWDGRYIPENVKGISYYLEQKNKEVAKRFNEIISNYSISGFFCSLLLSQTKQNI